MTSAQIEVAVTAAGLAPRGTIRLTGEERTGLLATKTSLVLVGFAGRLGWESFTLSPEAQDGLADPLDRWSRRVIDALAARCGATAVYPFGGEPFWPFQRWAQRAEPLHPSPLGLLIHPEFGLWHSYRGALAFAEELDVATPVQASSPCESCKDRPCLNACPVGAFTPGHYDVATCARWLRGEAGSTCMSAGCLSRSACPVGSGYTHKPDQASFGMKAFLAARD